MGPGVHDLKSIRLLNRLIIWKDATAFAPEELTWEGDVRHVEILAKQLGLSTRSSLRSTVSDKTNWKKKHPLLGTDLEAELVPVYKSATMRLAYLALDRPDVAFVSKELCRAVSRPTANAWEHLKHVTRYLLKAPRLQWVFMRQDPGSKLDGLSDSDWAGCPVTRRSTSCSVMRYGRHTLQVAASTQATVALSSGEAEFYA